MNLMRRIAGIMALSLIATQMFGITSAFATNTGDDECDAGSSDLEITIGDESVWLYTSDEFLVCAWNDGGARDEESVALSLLKSITVEMDDDESDGSLRIYLDAGGADTSNDEAVELPELDTFDIDVTTAVTLDGYDVDDAAGNSLRVTGGAKTLSFAGTTATFSGPKVRVLGGDLKDTIDFSGATYKVEVYGGDGDDLIKGGSNRDFLDGEGDYDTLYGGGGNDHLDCGGEGDLYNGDVEYGWGGPGDDFIEYCGVVAPGEGDDLIDEGDGSVNLMLTYADVTGGIELSLDSVVGGDLYELTTGGAAGDDRFDDGDDYNNILSVSGGQGDDVISVAIDQDNAAVLLGSPTVKGLGGDDVIRTDGVKAYGGTGNDLIIDTEGGDSKFYGEGGADVLRGKGGDDRLYGGNGRDQGWGASGEDLCRTEVANRCEFFGGKRQ